MKGVLLNLGLEQLADLAREIERGCRDGEIDAVAGDYRRLSGEVQRLTGSQAAGPEEDGQGSAPGVAGEGLNKQG